MLSACVHTTPPALRAFPTASKNGLSNKSFAGPEN